jgi:uncharacterized protein HemY
MKKFYIYGALMVGLILGMNLFFCTLAMAQQQMAPSKFPALGDSAAWADIEQRRQARLEMLQGVAEFNSGNYEQAVKHFESFGKVFPDDVKGKEYLELARKWAAKAK